MANIGRPSRSGKRFWVFSSVVLVIALGLGVLELIPANYWLFMPGNALAVAPMISVKGYPPVHARGGLYMTDVEVYRVNHLLEELYGRLSADNDLYPVQQVSGNLTSSQYNQVNAQLMGDSIKQAEVAALHVARGYSPQFPHDGAQVVYVEPRVPAARALRAGDIIEAVNGTIVRSKTELSPAVQHVRPGKMVHLRVKRGKRTLVLVVRTIADTSTGTNGRRRTLIGVQVQDQVVLPPFPVHISINAGDIGGPSAGLMFTLGLIQRIEQRDLTRGCKVAGTGTIDFQGNVGEIGGAKQKVIGARHAGIQYFLVPDTPGNLQPARAHAGNITVVPVKTLSQALVFLQHLKPCH